MLGGELPEIHQEISEDFYKTNYVKILDYFNKETNIFDFYGRIKTMNSLLDIMENVEIKRTEHYQVFTLSYCIHLEEAIKVGINISI